MEAILEILDRLNAAERRLRLYLKVLRAVIAAYEYSPILIFKRRKQVRWMINTMLFLVRNKHKN